MYFIPFNIYLTKLNIYEIRIYVVFSTVLT